MSLQSSGIHAKGCIFTVLQTVSSKHRTCLSPELLTWCIIRSLFLRDKCVNSTVAHNICPLPGTDIDGRTLRIKFKAKKRLTLTLAHTLIIEPPPIQFFLCKLPLVLKDRKPPLQFQILLGLCSESTYSPLLKHLPDSRDWASVAGIESTSLSLFPVFKTVPRGKITKDVINATVRVKKWTERQVDGRMGGAWVLGQMDEWIAWCIQDSYIMDGCTGTWMFVWLDRWVMGELMVKWVGGYVHICKDTYMYIYMNDSWLGRCMLV